MVNGMATRLQEENRRLRAINAELLATLKDIAECRTLWIHNNTQEIARTAIAKAEALDITP